MQDPGSKLPLLEVFEEDTDEPTFTIFESGAILQFLLDTYRCNEDIWVSASTFYGMPKSYFF